jgi:hypothetical protein
MTVWRIGEPRPACVFGCGHTAVDRAYGQPVCRVHQRICQVISDQERAEWQAKQPPRYVVRAA